MGYWAGPKGREFEAQWAAWSGAAHAVSCSSGTAALHLALAGLGIGPGDEVIVPSHTFISTSLAVLQAGAVPVFCDVTEDQTIDARAIDALCGPRTKAVIVVHLFGIVCAMDRVGEAAKRHGLAVVEDCAQCIGGEFRSRKAGTLGDAGCFSFSQTKHLSTAGEGGMVVTDDDGLAESCRSLRDYGRAVGAEAAGETHTGAAGAFTGAAGAFTRAGFNYRLTEIQSVVGLNELARLETWNLPRTAGLREDLRSRLLAALRREGAAPRHDGPIQRLLEVPPPGGSREAGMLLRGAARGDRRGGNPRLRRPVEAVLRGAPLRGGSRPAAAEAGRLPAARPPRPCAIARSCSGCTRHGRGRTSRCASPR